MRKILILLSVLAFAALANAQWQSVVGSPHDLSSTGGAPAALKATNTTWVCDFCHTPHQASAVGGQYPLWNHTPTATAHFGVYSSPTMNASPADIGVSAMGGAVVSFLCMSCHDGTIGMGNLYKQPVLTSGTTVSNSAALMPSTWSVMLGTSLTDDHPINFAYNNALYLADSGLNDPSTTAVSSLLVGGTVQCSSCHDVHNNYNFPFLVKSNASSALCTTCHHK